MSKIKTVITLTVDLEKAKALGAKNVDSEEGAIVIMDQMAKEFCEAMMSPPYNEGVDAHYFVEVVPE